VKMIRWEDQPSVKANPKLIEDFKTCYKDQSLTLDLIGGNFGMSATVVHDVAVRLGCERRAAKPWGRRAVAPGTSVNLLEDQIEKLKQELTQLEQKKIDLEIRAERQGSYIRVFGLDCDVLVSVSRWAVWLKAGGPQKIRQLIREEEWSQ
jgi:hypothetical protein